MPSKQQLETALRNADAAGDAEAATALANALRAGQYEDTKEAGTTNKAANILSLVPGPLSGAIGGGEALAQVGTGMLFSAVGGIAGLATGVADVASQAMSDDPINYDQSVNKASQTIANIQQAGTYEPRVQAGQDASGALGRIMSSDYNPLNYGKVLNRVTGASDGLAEAGFPALATGLDVGSDILAGLGVSKLASVGLNAARARVPSSAEASPSSPAPEVLPPAVMEPAVPATKDMASSFADAGMKNRIDTITASIRLNPERVAAAERLGLKPPIATLSDDASLHEIAGALAASPGSKAAANLADYHKVLTDRSKQLIEEAGGDLDKGLVSNQLKDKIDANIKLLSSQSGDIYKQIDAAVPADTIVNSKPLLRELNARGNKSQKGVAGLSTVEQDVFKTLQGKPTYFDIDNLRKDIGESIGGIKGSYPTASSATLKDMYGKLTQMQEGVATQVGSGAGALWAQAKELDKSRFALQDNSQFLFGKDLNGAVIPKVEQGLKQLAKGDPKILNAVIENVPAEMKHRVLVSGLDGMLSKSVQGESAISPAQFNKWYGDLSRSSTNKKLLHDNLPEGAGQRLDDMFKLSQGLQNVTNKVVRTGIVHDAFKNFDKNGGLIAKLYSAADKIDSVPVVGAAVGAPAVRVTSGILKLAVKEKTPAVQAADDLLADPSFRTAVLDFGKSGNAGSALQTTLKKKPSYNNFLKMVGDSDKAKQLLIINGGLVPFLMTSDEAQND